jgi:colicin import membrane protein
MRHGSRPGDSPNRGGWPRRVRKPNTLPLKKVAAAVERESAAGEPGERQAAAERARLEQEERELRAAAEKTRLEQEERERQAAAERARLEQEERTTSQVPPGEMQDQRDAAWEAERKAREKRLSDAVFVEWKSGGTVFGNDQDTELIKKLRSEVDEWLLNRSPGFEDRQARMREKERVETTRAMEAWLQRKKRK